jgi:dsDNA-specific endonuclease/ATPase MutS2
VKLCVERVRRGAVVSGPEVVSVVTLLQTSHSVRRSVNATVQEHPDRQLLMQPLLEMVSPMVTHPELVKVVWTVVDEDGSVKDSASPELRRARIQERTLEQRLLELLNKVGRDSFPDSQGQVNVLSSLNIVLLIQILICSHVSL